MYNLEVELPSQEIDKQETKVRAIKGNRGYLVGKKAAGEKVGPVKKKKGTKILKPRESYTKSQIVYQKPLGSGSTVKKEGTGKKTTKEQKGAMVYVVKKGDTLQKISSELYGTTKKWKKIFDANKDTLKDPDKIRVGQKLVIPDLE
ncbi:MAG: LysM peptidoglycan-binding domain-containing protein [Candidatus Omnitrophica bacterium]|nr:LysM peptidoglycan-binding domain-containing protein [Candidatus Omnitrophota bacterium]